MLDVARDSSKAGDAGQPAHLVLTFTSESTFELPYDYHNIFQEDLSHLSSTENYSWKREGHRPEELDFARDLSEAVAGQAQHLISIFVYKYTW